MRKKYLAFIGLALVVCLSLPGRAWADRYAVGLTSEDLPVEGKPPGKPIAAPFITGLEPYPWELRILVRYSDGSTQNIDVVAGRLGAISSPAEDSGSLRLIKSTPDASLYRNDKDNIWMLTQSDGTAHPYARLVDGASLADISSDGSMLAVFYPDPRKPEGALYAYNLNDGKELIWSPFKNQAKDLFIPDYSNDVFLQMTDGNWRLFGGDGLDVPNWKPLIWNKFWALPGIFLFMDSNGVFRGWEKQGGEHWYGLDPSERIDPVPGAFGVFVVYRKNGTEIWNFRNGMTVREIGGAKYGDMIWTDAKMKMAVGLRGGRMRLWNLETGEETERGVPTGASFAAFSSDYGVILVGFSDGRVVSYTIPAMHKAQVYGPFGSTVTAIADIDKTIYVGTRKGEIYSVLR